MQDSLIDSPTLVAAMASALPPLVLDCRVSRGESRAEDRGVPGSQPFDLERDMSSAPGDAGRHPLPTRQAFTATLQLLGISPDRPVVVFDDQGGRLAAARGWWMLACWARHPDVRVLDGGIQAWHAEIAGLGPMPVASPSDVSAWVPDYDESAWIRRERLAQEGGQLIDARTASRFRGEEEPLDPVAGHIPGAVCRPCADNLDPSGRFKTTRQLAAALPKAEVLTAYCGSGVTACHNILAYAVAGLPLPRLYVGSWSEWVRDPLRPVATGS
ncbi:sulfurtransferase [Salinicola aestuarinus]|uniref:sulfurtransferase n=1 Tax=Salinicola aestuarinus TaxID=1949082 RepID=UPI000DA246CB|nr:sulfurtransferase [Salinicola aestuarinus]